MDTAMREMIIGEPHGYWVPPQVDMRISDDVAMIINAVPAQSKSPVVGRLGRRR